MSAEITRALDILDGRERIVDQPERDWETYVVRLADSQDHWLSYAFKGFSEIKRQSGSIGHFVSIGTGSGIDAIGAMEIMQPERVTLTDVTPAFLDRAQENIAFYKENGGQQTPVKFLLGNLCEPLDTDKADVIYANLPHLPVPPERRTQLMENGTSAVFFDPNSVQKAPVHIDRHLLSLQHALLWQARDHLTEAGKVVLNLGARMPLPVIYEIFISVGYEPAIAYFGLKLQNNPLGSLAHYAAHEEDDITFSYYPYAKSREQLEGKEVVSVEQMIAGLAMLRLSAKEAVLGAAGGEQMGYIATLIIAEKLPDTFYSS